MNTAAPRPRPQGEPRQPDPQAHVTPLIGHRARVTFVTGDVRTGTILGCGPSGFTITSGIGGRMLVYYSETDRIDDLGAADPLPPEGELR